MIHILFSIILGLSAGAQAAEKVPEKPTPDACHGQRPATAEKLKALLLNQKDLMDLFFRASDIDLRDKEFIRIDKKHKGTVTLSPAQFVKAFDDFCDERNRAEQAATAVSEAQTRRLQRLQQVTYRIPSATFGNDRTDAPVVVVPVMVTPAPVVVDPCPGICEDRRNLSCLDSDYGSVGGACRQNTAQLKRRGCQCPQ